MKPVLKQGLWFSAEIKRCESLFLSAVVLHKGDEDRGQILIKHYVHGEGARVFTRKLAEFGRSIDLASTAW